MLPGRALGVSVPVANELRFTWMSTHLEELGYQPVVVRDRPRRGGWRTALLSLLATPRLGYLAVRRRPVLVFTDTSVWAPALALIKLVLRDRVVTVVDVLGLLSLEIEQSTPSRSLRTVYRPIWRVLERLQFSAADLVLAVNDRHAELVTQKRPGTNVHTLRHTTGATPTTVSAPEREAIGIPTDAVAVGFAGSLIYSRLDPIFAAWAELDDLPLCLVVVGDGPDLHRYRELAFERGWLGRSVVFLGALPYDETAATLKACDIAYSECWSEAGFPTKVFDYMALGLPIVVEGKPQMREVLTEGQNAVFFRTPGELAAALRLLASDPVLRAQFGRRAQKSFLGAHTPAHRLHELAALLGVDHVAEVPQPAATTIPGERRRPEPRLVTVVVPVRNAAETLERQLEAIAGQDYGGAWEVVIADNGSLDGTVEVAERWAATRPSWRVVDASGRKGAAHARNQGALAGRGDFLTFCDADDVVGPGWLGELARAARRGDLVGGRLAVDGLNDSLRKRWQNPPARTRLITAHAFLPFASSGNCGVWADVFEHLGGFDEKLLVAEDIDLSWRSQLAGFRICFALDAVVELQYRLRLGDFARQQYSYGYSAAQLFRRFAAAGMPRPRPSLALLRWMALGLSLPAALVVPRWRGRWVGLAAHKGGKVVGSVRNKVLYL